MSVIDLIQESTTKTLFIKISSSLIFMDFCFSGNNSCHSAEALWLVFIDRET